MNEQAVDKTSVIRWKLRDVIVSVAIMIAVNVLFHLWIKRQILFINHAAYLSWAVGLLLTMGIVPVAIIFGFYRQKLTEVNWKSKSLRKDIVFAFVAVGVLLLVMAGFAILCNMLTGRSYPSDFSQELLFCQMMSMPHLLLFLLFMGLLGPICEEIFWRGFVYQALRKKMPLLPALFCQALLFAASHFMFNVQLLKLFLLGLALGYAFHKRHSLVTPICIHVCLNLMLVGYLVAGIQSTGGVGNLRSVNESAREVLGTELDRETQSRLIEKHIKNMYSEDDYTVDYALQCLYMIGAPAVPALINVLRDESTPHKALINAIAVLRFMEDRRAICPLEELLVSHENDRCKMYAINALSMLGDKRDVPKLIELWLQQEDVMVKSEFAMTLKSIADETNIQEFNLVYNNGHDRDFQILSGMILYELSNDKKFLHPLEVALGSEDYNDRHKAILFLRGFTGKEFDTFLNKGLTDSDKHVRKMAEIGIEFNMKKHTEKDVLDTAISTPLMELSE